MLSGSQHRPAARFDACLKGAAAAGCTVMTPSYIRRRLCGRRYSRYFAGRKLQASHACSHNLRDIELPGPAPFITEVPAQLLVR